MCRASVGYARAERVCGGGGVYDSMSVCGECDWRARVARGGVALARAAVGRVRGSCGVGCGWASCGGRASRGGACRRGCCACVCGEGPPARRTADRVLASRVCVLVCRACAVCSRRVCLSVVCDSLSYWCGRVVCCVLYMNFFLVPIICGVLWQFVAVRGNLWQFVAVRGSLR